MTIELLFAKASQGRNFLLMVLLGAALALVVQLAGFLHRKSTWLGLAADLLCAVGLALGMAQILLTSGEGLRLYGLLGLCIGGAVYAAGIAPGLGWIIRHLQRRMHKNFSPQPAGKRPSSEE